MSLYILSRFSGRILCVALVLATIVIAFGVNPTFAAEAYKEQAAGLVTKGFVSEPLGIVKTDLSKESSEPLSLTNSEAEKVSGPFDVSDADLDKAAFELNKKAKSFSDIETAAGVEMVDGEFVFSAEEGDDEALYDIILRVKRKKDVLSSAIIAFERAGRYYIPLQEITQLVKFPTVVDVETGSAHGSFYNVENTYHIDLIGKRFTVRGDEVELAEGSFLLDAFEEPLSDIYIALDVLNKIIPLRLEVDFDDMVLDIKTPKKLPYELERERRKSQKNLAGHDDAPLLDLEYIPNSYKLLGRPTFTLSDSLIWDGGRKTLQNTATIAGQMDVLGMRADFSTAANYIPGNEPDLSNVRLRFTRRGFGNKTLPFGLKLFQAGDVSAALSPYVQKRISGVGFYISNKERPTERFFDEVTINGTGTPGWEVEIYRGNMLLDFTYVDERGEYSFENIQLNYGKNELRTVLYGPQGEVEEYIKEYNIGRTQLKPGQMTFEAASIESGLPLIDVSEHGIKSAGKAQHLRVNRGINKSISSFVTLSKLPTKEGEKKYLTAGAEFNAFKGRGQIEIYKEINGGEAFDGRFARKFAGISTSIKAALFKDFNSPDIGYGAQAKRFKGELRANKSFELPIGQLGLNLSAQHSRRNDGNRESRFTAAQSLTTSRASLNHSITTNLDDGEHNTTTGIMSLNVPLSKHWDFRTSLDYDKYPKFNLGLSRTELRYDDGDKFSAALHVRQAVQDRENTSLGLNTSYDFGTFNGGAELNWDRSDGVKFILRASTIFGPESPSSNDYVFDTKYNGYATAYKIRLYHDRNANGIFDGDDEPVEKTRVNINGVRTKPSDKDGVIDHQNAGSARVVTLTLYRESLSNPFLIPLKGDGYETILRPGTKPFIDFPLVEAGGIDGTVSDAQSNPIPGMKIELIGNHGLVLAETRTGFDGFYQFELVRPGTYMVRPDASFKVNVPPKTVRLTSDDLFAYGVDLSPVEQELEVSATAEIAAGDRGWIAQLDDRSLVADGTLKPAPHSIDGNFSAVVHQVRIGEHPYKVRLVLDLSVMASYRLSEEEDGAIINIDLPDTAWEAPRAWELSNHPLFEDVKVLALAGEKGGTRLRLKAHRQAEIFYNAMLPAEGSKPARIYIDFLRK